MTTNRDFLRPHLLTLPIHRAMLRAVEAKLFAGAYALFAGLIFLVVAGIMLGPVAHRLLHRFHWEMKE